MAKSEEPFEITMPQIGILRNLLDHDLRHNVLLGLRIPMSHSFPALGISKNYMRLPTKNSPYRTPSRIMKENVEILISRELVFRTHPTQDPRRETFHITTKGIDLLLTQGMESSQSLTRYRACVEKTEPTQENLKKTEQAEKAAIIKAAGEKLGELEEAAEFSHNLQNRAVPMTDAYEILVSVLGNSRKTQEILEQMSDKAALNYERGMQRS